MIASLKGLILRKEEDSVILDVKGVGYLIRCSKHSLKDVGGKDIFRFWIYTHVREDALELFGFSRIEEKELFVSLLKVNGIGPKMATQILSASSPEKLVSSIKKEDVKGLSELPKIGKKKAEQIIFHLRGKLPSLNSSQTKEFVAKEEIISALVNLGFKPSDVKTVVEDMEEDTDLQEGIKEGLQSLTQGF